MLIFCADNILFNDSNKLSECVEVYDVLSFFIKIFQELEETLFTSFAFMSDELLEILESFRRRNKSSIYQKEQRLLLLLNFLHFIVYNIEINKV